MQHHDRPPVADELGALAVDPGAAATGAHVVKAFHLCSADVWRDPPAVDGAPPAVPLAGDDRRALELAGGPPDRGQAAR